MIDFNEDIRNNWRNDTLLALLIDKYIFPFNLLIIGDDNVKHLPDLWDKDRTNGFEFVQCELDCDLDAKNIYKALKLNKNNYNKTIEMLKRDNFPIDEYSFQRYGSKIGSFSHKESGRSYGYLAPIYEKNIRNKLEKLNKGNYSGCQRCSLVISNIERSKDKSDVDLVKKIYERLSLNYTEKFDNVYVITTTGIYRIANDIEIMVEYKCSTFSYYVSKMKDKLRFTEEN